MFIILYKARRVACGINFFLTSFRRGIRLSVPRVKDKTIYRRVMLYTSKERETNVFSNDITGSQWGTSEISNQ